MKEMMEGSDRPMPTLSDKTTAYREQVLQELTVWCITSTAPYHWFSSFKFTDNVMAADNQTYAGISFNMFKPIYHECTRSGSRNYLGSLDIQVRQEKHLTSKWPGMEVTVKLPDGVTVGHLVDFVRENGLHYYRFHDDGSGCLCWQLVFIEKLIKKGWVPATFLEELKQQIQAKRKTIPEVYIIYPPIAGKFYTP